MNNKIFRLWLKMTNTLSGSLNVFLTLILVFCYHTSFADTAPDFTKTSNYKPGGKYRMFGAGRGTVEKVRNTIKPTANTSSNAGPLRLESQSYAGYVHYEQRFSNHPLSEHGSFVNDRSINIGDFHGSISNAKLGAVKAKITGREWHPVDAYDAADGGDHPYDSYYYYVYGTTNSLSVQPVELPNLPSFSNPFAKNNQSNQNNNTLPEKGSADADNRTRELTGSDNLPNNPNRQPESIANNGEVPQPQALPQPQSSFWDALASGFWGGLKELAAGARDYQADGAQYSVPVGAWDNGQNQYAQPDPYAPSNYAEGVGANIAAISSIVGTKSPASLGRNVAKHADDVAKAATNVAKKVEKTTDIAKATPPANTQLPATTNGTANAATYPKLKEDLARQNLENIAKQDPRLAKAVQGSGTSNPNFSIGSGTRAEADQLGKTWVGDGARLNSTGNGWISADGTRGYRFPTKKPNTPSQYSPTGTQANFETYEYRRVQDKNGNWSINPQPVRTGNGHMVITD